MVLKRPHVMKKPPVSAQRTYTPGSQTRQRIVDATASLIYAKGVEGTTLDDVPQRLA